MNPILMVIVYCLTETGVYLGLKKTKIGEGSLISVGGKVNDNETPIAAIIREAKEEWDITINPENLRQAALLHISREGRGHEIDLIVFFMDKWEGEFRETREIGVPTLYPYTDLPYKKMMPADGLWLPAALLGIKLEAQFTYNKDRTAVIGSVEASRVEAF